MQSNRDYGPAITYLHSVDPVLATIITAVGPCELQPSGHSFAALTDAIISQQISVKAATAITARVTATLGELSPAAFLSASEETLRGAGLSGQKARYLRDLAAHAASGALDALPTLDDEAAIAALVAIKGIGRWTAEIYLLFALGRPDMLPADDLGLRYAVQQFYGYETPPPAAEVRSRGERWRPYRSVASWYLWRARRSL